MKGIELPKAFNPKDFEKRIYGFWLEKKAFAPDMEASDPFVIVIPPPNVTGVLHMGHGLNNILQDILVRYHRMTGRSTLWVPGTDHAGIATQNVVERKLREKGIERADIGREAFIEETWKVKEEHHTEIVRQLKEIGASCDWDRERFTLDEGLSKAVREVFVGLYERDLIYRGNYLVNWCSSCGTALSDDEVEHHEVAGKMTHITYPYEDASGALEIATTRPETLLGDTAVAVHPEDARYAGAVGKKLLLPLTGRVIPVVADSFVEKDFGTGAVKVTPAHDLNDWEIGGRHSLEKINILHPKGYLNENVPEKYRGLTVSEARKQVVKDLKEAGLFVREEEHPHQVGHCYRCGTMVEPYMSEQWFVRMRPLADKGLRALREGELRFYPKKWENTYTHWMNTIRDWCISRQLWWGHRVPVWYCGDCGAEMALREDPETCTACGSGNVSQDEDVLDTWFSSWLWPFSTLGWPEKTADLEKFFPTTALVTAYDIIFFWVARMIMAGIEFMGEVPFRDIYIHGLIRDKQGRKMSKSLGNGIDPLEVVEEYGADALKFTLTYLAAQGQDILLDKESFKLGSKFANKIWNAARYLLMNLEGRNLVPRDEIEPEDFDRWIYHRLNAAVGTVRSAVASFRFNDAAGGVYDFFWNDFCDWYIEISKLKLYDEDNAVKDRAASLLLYVLEETLRLLHPFLSFISEEIYQKLPEAVRYPAAVTAPYPEERPEREQPAVAGHAAVLQELVRGVRTLRSEFTIPPAAKIAAVIRVDADCPAAGFLTKHIDIIRELTQSSELRVTTEQPEKKGSIPVAGTGFESYVYIQDAVDVPKEIEKLKKEQEKLEQQLRKTGKKLVNPQFLEKAPEAVIKKEKEIERELSGKLEKIGTYLRDLE